MRTDPLQSLDAYIEQAMRDWAVPGLALAVVKDDAVVYARGYGVRELDKNQPVDEHTLFSIASNTKAFTAAAMGLLVQEGEIGWDDPVVKYLSAFQMYDPYVTHEIRVRDLLCHRSGLGTWQGDLMAFGSRYSRDELLHRVRYLKPAFSFRAGYGYSNLMFVAAGQIIPAVTGLSWDAFVQERLLRPLGMARSNTSVRDFAGVDNVARPHTAGLDGRIVVIPDRLNDNMGPAGSINSSAIEMAAWLRLQLGNGVYAGNRLLESAVFDEMRTPHTPRRMDDATRKLYPARHWSAYGLGLFLADHAGRLLVYHGGAMDGMLSITMTVPEERLGVVVLANGDQHDLNPAVALYIVDAFLGLPQQDWSARFHDSWSAEIRKEADAWKKAKEARVRGAPPSLPLAAFAGTYSNPVYGPITVALQDGRLCLHLGAHPDIVGELEHWHYDTFLSRWNDVVFRTSLVPFILDGQGHVEELRFKVRPDWIDASEYAFRRVPVA